MKLIRSLMGRRQFLIGAVATSTVGLASKKLAGALGPGPPTGSAMAAEKTAAAMAGMSNRYSHLFSPLQVGSQLLKSRMYFTHATPHFFQGPETFPAVYMRDFYLDVAKAGAAIIMVRIITDRVRSEQRGDSAHMIIYDLEDTGVQNYFDLMIEGMNMHGTKAAFDLQFGARPQMQMMQMPTGARGEGGEMPSGAPGQMPDAGGGQMPAMGEGQMPAMEGRQGGMPGMERGGGQAETEMSDEDIEKNIEKMLTEANFYKNHGFGAAVMRGGSNKASLAAFKALRSAWPEVIIMSRLNVGDSVEDAVSEAKKLEGYVDILTVQNSNASLSHCTSYNSEKNNPGTLKYVEAVKKAGVKIAVAPNGGYQSLEKNEEYIATGKCDMIAMGRAFIADADYAQKAYEGRGEDVIPCLLCNKCHGVSFSGSWFNVCSVNPKLGIAQAVQKIAPPTASRKVAVIGGGPAGMKAAITAAERGHQVTLYEKTDYLGGQLRHAEYSPYKWTYKDFRDYLARQVEKSGVEVKLNTAATPDMIKKIGYDAVVVALGSDVVIPKTPGADGKNVYNVFNVYGKEKELGKNVVVVGAGAIGVDTGMYLARAGHDVTILASGRELMDRGGPHQGEIIQGVYRALKNFSTVTQATPTGISKGKVTYKDASGSEKSIPADSVVIYSGRKPRQEEAVRFSGLATQFFIVGDCTGNCGNVQKSIRNAFFVASQI